MLIWGVILNYFHNDRCGLFIYKYIYIYRGLFWIIFYNDRGGNLPAKLGVTLYIFHNGSGG
jgi:hypothetical protein